MGINLNPDKACNFDCIYCQVDRTIAPRTRIVDLDILRDEIGGMLASVADGSLFHDPEFVDTPGELRRLNDIAFSGDGEPTICPSFAQAVQLAADLKRAHDLSESKLVLITDACYLTKPEVVAGLQIMDRSNGQVWAKLDAGTEEYYRRVNRPNFPLAHVIDQIKRTARDRSVVIQSLFMRIDDRGPDEAEIRAYVDRLNEMRADGAKIEMVQVYTVARRPAERHVSPLSVTELDAIAATVATRTGTNVEKYYG